MNNPGFKTGRQFTEISHLLYLNTDHPAPYPTSRVRFEQCINSENSAAISEKLQLMVDSAFLEWDKASMFYLMQQREKALQGNWTGQPALVLPLKAKSSLLLALSIIPLSSGVFLVA